MSLRVISVFDTLKNAEVVNQVIVENKLDLVIQQDLGQCLIDSVQKYNPDAVVVNMDSPTLDFIDEIHEVNQQHPVPVILFCENSGTKLIEKATKAGVNAFIVDGLEEKRVLPIINIAMSRFKETQSLKNELANAKESLQERKIIEQAKGLLMDYRSMKEHEAYQALRKMAMDQNKKLIDVSENVVSMFKVIS